MLMLEFQLRMLKLAGEMMGAAADALTPAPATAETTPARGEASSPTDGNARTEGSSALLAFPRLASGMSRALSEVQPAPKYEAPHPVASLFPFAALFPLAKFPAMGGALPTSPFFNWAALTPPHAGIPMTWPGLLGAPTMSWASPWTGMMAWSRMAAFPFGSANASLSPFMMGPWAIPAWRAWIDLAGGAAPAPSAYRSASGYAVAQVVARSLLLAAGSLMTLAMALQSGFLA